VDAIFNHGRLAAWAYSDFQRSRSAFEPSEARHYANPKSLDFIEQLERIGAATGAHGFANCSFFYLPDTGSHLFFECDLRANHWLRLFPHFGIDIPHLLSDEWDGVCGSVINPEGGAYFIHYGRSVQHAAERRDWRAYFAAIRSYRHSTDYLADEGHPIIVTLLAALRFLPDSVKRTIKSLRRYI
jgi:predicted ATP-grasp superfamily ATP-dependent carboligase